MTAGTDFRDAVAEEFVVETPGDQVVLDRIVALLDQLEGMEAELAESGTTIEGGNGQVAAHPLLSAIRSHSDSITKLVGRLGLRTEDPRTVKAREAAERRWAK